MNIRSGVASTLFSSILILMYASQVSAGQDDVDHRDWQSFVSSKNASDRKLVAEIGAMKWYTACIEWGRSGRKNLGSTRTTALREYLIHDRSINSVDLMQFGARIPEIGMTTCGVYSILGLPDRANYTKTRQSESTQMIYRRAGLFVYTEARPGDGNGIVTAIQN